MGIQFYPAYTDQVEDHLELMCLDVNVFNAQVVFAMLGVKGTGPQGTIGELNHPEILEALLHMAVFIQEGSYISHGIEESRARNYFSSLSLIMGFCLGNKCKFCWS